MLIVTKAQSDVSYLNQQSSMGKWVYYIKVSCFELVSEGAELHGNSATARFKR